MTANESPILFSGPIATINLQMWHSIYRAGLNMEKFIEHFTASRPFVFRGIFRKSWNELSSYKSNRPRKKIHGNEINDYITYSLKTI